MTPLLRRCQAAGRRAPRVAALAASLASSACSLASGTPPTVDVTSVRLVGTGLAEQQLAVTLCVGNPRADRIAFRRVSVALDVSGSPLAAGASDVPVDLPPYSFTAVPFTVVTTVRNVGPQVLGILRSGGLDYRLHGTVSLTGALGLTLPFSRSGHLDLLADGVGLASRIADAAPSQCRSATAITPAAT